MRSRTRKRWPVGSYAELRNPEWLAAHMTLQRLDSAKVARRCTYEQSRPVSRQMISYLKTGRLKTCKRELAEAICRVLDVPTDALFAVHEGRKEVARNAQRGAA